MHTNKLYILTKSFDSEIIQKKKKKSSRNCAPSQCVIIIINNKVVRLKYVSELAFKINEKLIEIETLGATRIN